MKKKFEKANNFSKIFELIKEMVKKQLGLHRAGLMLGLSDLGIQHNHLVGAVYPFGSNIIIINTSPLRRIRKELFKPYVLVILLHEYLHTLGFRDEEEVQELTYIISTNVFGKDHIITKVARNFNYLFRDLTPEPPQDTKIKLVEEFDITNTNYIG